VTIHVENARIAATTLGREDRGILTAVLQLEFADGTRGFGGHALDSYAAGDRTRVPTAAAGLFVARVIDTVGVDSWEKLKGQLVRARVEGGKYAGRVVAIGHPIKDA
jgi:hypothetical protein